VSKPTGEGAAGAPLLATHDLALALPSGRELALEAALRIPGRRLLCAGDARYLLDAMVDPDVLRRGEMQIWGEAPSVALASGRAGYCPEQLPAPADFDVFGALLGSARLIGCSATDVRLALERTQAEGLGRRRLQDLGVLERRLVGLAHGLTGDPELVLLDDPFADLEDTAAELVWSVLMRELEHRAWIFGSNLRSPWARRFALAAEQALTGEGGTILGPLPAAELVASGAWARFDHVSEELLAAVRQRGADVVRMPRHDVLLVRRLGGLALAEAAAGVGCSLLELVPLTPDS